MKKLSLQYLIALNLFITIFSLSIHIVFAHAPFSGDSAFKSWYFTPGGVYGRIALSKLSNRSYVKISRPNKNEVVVWTYNPAGVVLATTNVQFANGKIALMATYNRWNDAVDTLWFKAVEANEFLVTEKLNGKNPNLPCQSLRFIFKDDLISEIYCMQDSNKTGYNQEGVAHYVFDRYDDPKRFSLIRSESFFGDIDNPVLSRKSDCHKIINIYDENGNLKQQSLYGLQDEPVTDRFGSFQTKMRYDKNDNESEVAYFDTKGFAWNEYLGCALRTYDYSNGLLEKETFYRSDYTVTRPRRVSDSVAITKHVYNKNGDEIIKTFFDEREIEINNPSGIHRTTFSYNAAGMLVDIEYFDKKGSMAADETGVHRYHFERNSNGQMISKSEFNVRDLPLIDPTDGTYTIKYQYDNWGRIISSSCWINDSIKMSSPKGYHEIIFQYNTAGMLSKLEYLDGNKKITAPALGFSSEQLSYNSQGMISERKYFKYDKPVILQDTSYAVSLFSSIQYAYDFFNRTYSLEYFNDQGKPVNMRLRLWTGEETHCHKVEFSYTGTQVISETLYDVDNTPLGNIDCKQDNCILPTGTGIQVKKLFIRISSSSPKKYLLRRVEMKDSLFFGDQVAFLNNDSVVLFLNTQENSLSESSCATFYRICRINKYYQLNGIATDFYLDNDTIGAQMKYENGVLNGPCTYYYKNGSIKEKGEYRHNQRIGLWDYYYESGLNCKTIQFDGDNKFLKDYFEANGNQSVRDGNGVFTGPVLSKNGNSTTIYSVTGNIKGGLQDGIWKMYLGQSTSPSFTEKFSVGKFNKGTAYGYALSGETMYKKYALSSFESFHPQEQIDYYGQNAFCSIRQKNLISRGSSTAITKDFYPEIHEGIDNILRTNNFKDYTGWIFLYLHFDEHGLLRNKNVRLYHENAAFKTELLKFLDGLSEQTFSAGNGNEFSKFYIVLVEDNQMVIPEELLQQTRKNIR